MVRQVTNASIIASALLLSACAAGAPVSSPGAGAGGAPLPAAISPDKNCRGTGGVLVAPCPIRLTRHTRQGIVVTVSGPGVVNSYLGSLNGCFNGHECYVVEREGSSYTQWRFTHGSACGGADVQFIGVNASGGQVGYFFLKVKNEFCRG